MSGIKTILGAASFNKGFAPNKPNFDLGTVEQVREVLDFAIKNDCTTIDTARRYGNSEDLLGEAGAGERFTIDTKAKAGGEKNGGSRERVLADFEESKKLLNTNVDVYYVHIPDRTVPLEETLAAMNEVHKQGFFKRLGVSNFSAEEVQQAYDICKKNGYTLPQVYQGHYSPVSRKPETVLFPTLRKLGISYYAYSPLAGGFLTKTRAQIEAGTGRFVKGTFLGDAYLGMYGKPSYLDALAVWEEIAKEEGCSQAQLAYRWVKYNSPLKPEYGDGLIFGGSSIAQIKQTLEGINAGPLSSKAAGRIEELWKGIEPDAILDFFNE